MMVTFQERKEFTFVSKGLPADTFTVVRFKGVESISRPYVYDITLASDDPDIDLKAVLSNPATLTITRGGEDFPIHGRVARFDQMHEVKQHVFYRAELVPRLWEAGLARGNRLFLDKKVPEVIEQMLKQAGLTTKDYELKLTKSYPQWEYICQYQESDLDFLSRWMEREGIFYFFEQTEQGEKMIVADDKSAHRDVPGEKELSYSPPSALLPAKEDVVATFLCRQAVLPNKVVLKDYNYRTPSLEIKAEATVDPDGKGEVFLYGEHFKTPEEGSGLAKVRAEELLCREKVFQGEATAPGLSPGFTFELAGHYREGYNQKYLLVEIEREGMQTGEFLAGLEGEAAAGEETPSFTSRFSCIPSSVPFRPERKTPKPRFYGTMNAVVDAAGDGSTAELDDQGRYKVILPFDLSGNKDGKASRWIRMAQPYSGPEYGVHFPLHKGAEVLLTFVGGDPDRPVISGALPHPETKSPVTSANQTKSIIRDNFGNEIVMDATPGDEHIRIHSPHNNSGIELGRSMWSWTGSDENAIKIGNSFEAGLGMSTSAYLGTVSQVQLGLLSNLTWGLGVNFVSGGSYNWNNAWDSTYTKGPITTYTVRDILTISGDDHVLGADDKVCIVGGAGPRGDGRSIVNVYPGSLVLSTGGKSVQELSSGSVFPGSLYDDKIPRPVRSSLFGASALNWADRCMVAIAMLSALVPAGIGIFTDVKDQPEAEKETNWIPVWTGIITALLAIFYAEIKKHKEFEKAEPVEHTDPAAKLQMTKDGEVIISSTGGQSERRIDLRLYGSPQPRTGAADYPETGLSMDKDGARLFSGDKSGSGNKSKILISKKKGTILVSNSKSKGMIKVFSKDKIVLDSKKQINLQTRKISSRKGSLHLKNLVAKA